MEKVRVPGEFYTPGLIGEMFMETTKGEDSASKAVLTLQLPLYPWLRDRMTALLGDAVK